MQNLPGQIASALQQSTTFLCRIWTLTLQNGTVHRFTDLTRDVVFGGETFIYDPGIRVSSVVISSGGQPDNAQIEVAASDNFLALNRIRQGALKNAIFDLWIVDWRNPDFYGKIELFSGGTVETKFNNKGRVDIGLDSNIGGGKAKMIGENYSRQCRAQLGDARCKVDLEGLKRAFTVDAIYGDGYKFASITLMPEPEDLFQFGHIIWSGGLNDTLRDEVKNSRPLIDSGEVTLSLYPRNPVGLGDTGFIYPGCDFNIATCRLKFNNAVNFRGEPYVPPPQITVYAGKATDNWRVTYNNLPSLLKI